MSNLVTCRTEKTGTKKHTHEDDYDTLLTSLYYYQLEKSSRKEHIKNNEEKRKENYGSKKSLWSCDPQLRVFYKSYLFKIEV